MIFIFLQKVQFFPFVLVLSNNIKYYYYMVLCVFLIKVFVSLVLIAVQCFKFYRKFCFLVLVVLLIAFPSDDFFKKNVLKLKKFKYIFLLLKKLMKNFKLTFGKCRTVFGIFRKICNSYMDVQTIGLETIRGQCLQMCCHHILHQLKTGSF